MTVFSKLSPGLTYFLLNRKMLQSLGRPEVHMALDVVLVRGSGQEHEGCLLLTSEVLFVVSVSEDTQQQAFPVTEIDCAQDSKQSNLLTVQLKQPRMACDVEVPFSKWGLGLPPGRLKHRPVTVPRHLCVSGWAAGALESCETVDC